MKSPAFPMGCKNRRQLVKGVGAVLLGLAAPWPALAQSSRVYRVGILRPTLSDPQGGGDITITGLPQALRELGYVEGQNLALQLRYAEGKLDRLPALARELVDGRPDVIVAVTAGSIRAVKAATSSIPIVFFGNFVKDRNQIIPLAARYRLPAIYEWPEQVEDGGLMSYGPESLRAIYRRIAVQVDKVLKGATVGDIPVEQPSKLELVINVKTAAAMGLTLPQSLVLRADRIIE